MQKKSGLSSLLVLLLGVLLLGAGLLYQSGNSDAQTIAATDQQVAQTSGENQQQALAELDQQQDGPVSALGEGATKVRGAFGMQAQPRFGDLDELVASRVIRALVVPNKTSYFLDGVHQRGASFELLEALQKMINAEYTTQKHLKIHVVVIPAFRDTLLQDLAAGRGDIALANLTVTPEREQLVDFTDPMYKKVDEIVVAAAGQPELKNLDDLSGKMVYVRRSSSFWQNLVQFNAQLEAKGLAPVTLLAADELLETEDLLEMVNAGLIEYTIADSHLASFWQQIYTDMRVYPDLAITRGNSLSWAVRKNTPQLQALLNRFVAANKKGTLIGNMMFNRYLKDTKWARRAMGDDDLAKYENVLATFKKYGKEYNFDPLMLAAVGYQESRLDNSVRSHVGAVGIMQMMPTTAADKNVGINQIDQVENNIHAGTKYLRFLADRYFDDPALSDLDKKLFAFASYNAGPARVTKLRKAAAEQGLDPNVWFKNVEVIAARDIGRETVQYVSNIYKYYLAYKMLELRRQLKPAQAG